MEIGDSTETRNVWLCMRFMFICLKIPRKHTAVIAEWYNPCVRVPEGTFWSRLRIPPAALFLFFRGSASNRYNNLWQLHNIDPVRLVQRVSSSCKKTHILNEKLTCIHANEHVFASVRNRISCNTHIYNSSMAIGDERFLYV